eukprot:Pompholyxophrys_punicea_v1_NODE_6_length_8794_cov_7.233894.p5 type:complete len:190 gc:universal NODE_6_length_8794_cov_7.233894:3855-4424(+)
MHRPRSSSSILSELCCMQCRLPSRRLPSPPIFLRLVDRTTPEHPRMRRRRRQPSRQRRRTRPIESIVTARCRNPIRRRSPLRTVPPHDSRPKRRRNNRRRRRRRLRLRFLRGHGRRPTWRRNTYEHPVVGYVLLRLHHSRRILPSIWRVSLRHVRPRLVDTISNKHRVAHYNSTGPVDTKPSSRFSIEQ